MATRLNKEEGGFAEEPAKRALLHCIPLEEEEEEEEGVEEEEEEVVVDCRGCSILLRLYFVVCFD